MSLEVTAALGDGVAVGRLEGSPDVVGVGVLDGDGVTLSGVVAPGQMMPSSGRGLASGDIKHRGSMLLVLVGAGDGAGGGTDPQAVHKSVKPTRNFFINVGNI